YLVRVLPTPHSALFPYTTLFRSRLGGLQVSLAQERLAQRDVGLHVLPIARQDRVELRDGAVPLLSHQEAEGQLEAGVDRVGLERDRKSTRLNSSHDQISYAVFCL